MCEFDEKLENAHMGRLIHMLSHQMKRNSNGMESVIGNDELTVMQKHVLKFVLLKHIAFAENYLTKGISEEDVIICKKVLCQMYHNLSEMNKKTDKEADRKNEQETV